MDIELVRIGESLEVLELVVNDVRAETRLRYHAQRVLKSLRNDADTLAPLLVGEWEQDKWMGLERSSPFTPIPRAVILESQLPLSPLDLRRLLALSTPASDAT